MWRLLKAIRLLFQANDNNYLVDSSKLTILIFEFLMRHTSRNSASLADLRVQSSESQCHSPAVLVPRLDLRVRKAQLGRQLHPVLHTQVLLALEALLQGLELVVRERSPRLSLFLGEASARVAAFTPARRVLVLVACNMKQFANHPVPSRLSPASDLF